MKTPQEKRAKEKLKKEKLAIRQVWKTTPKEKKGATWEFELFKKIAFCRAFTYTWQEEDAENSFVMAKHIDFNGNETTKVIALSNLTPTNFSHTIPKSRWEEYRLDPNNIVIVSRASHHYEHTKQILKVDYPN